MRIDIHKKKERVGEEHILNENVMVSVLIATYNHEKYIAKTIESALNQKDKF